MRSTSRTITSLVLLGLVLFSLRLNAQTRVDQDDVIRVDTDVTNLPFTATDKDKRFITTLKAEDVRVLEDGVPQQLFTFQRETDRPLALAFLIDVSISQEASLPEEKAAVRTFMENIVQSSKDEVAIVPFTSFAYLEQEMTRDMLSAYRVLQRVEVGVPMYLGSGRPLTGIPTGPGMAAPPDEGRTSLWDAVALTSNKVMAISPGQRRRAIIVLTDGIDTSSRLTKKDAITGALSAETVVYAIGIRGEASWDSKDLDKEVLRDLAERTGGRAFFPGKNFDMKAAFYEIEKELRTQYLIAYSSTNKRHDGSYRQISIEITNPQFRKDKVQLRHRPGYYAKHGS